MFTLARCDRHALLAIGLCVLLFSTPILAADIIVVTDSHHPVQAPASVRIIELDRPSRIEAELAAQLPAIPTHSATLVQQRLKDGGRTLQQRIGTAYQGVVDAWSLGVTTIPAVIVNQRYVVYGEPDVAKAIALIEAHQGVQP